jgi:hypothetical protein
MSAGIIADSPDRGFPWICWPVITAGTITFARTSGADVVVTMPSTAWVLSQDATALDVYSSVLGIINASFTETNRGLILTATGRIEFRWPATASTLDSITFSSTALAARFGFSTVGPHAAVDGVVTSTRDITGGGGWWSPNVSNQYVEANSYRVYSSEAPDGAQPAVATWGSQRRGLLRLEMIPRAYAYQDAAADPRYATPAGATTRCETLEDALVAATDGLPWRVHLRQAGVALLSNPTTVYRDVWVGDEALLRSLRDVANDVDAGRLVSVDMPLIVTAP